MLRKQSLRRGTAPGSSFLPAFILHQPPCLQTARAGKRQRQWGARREENKQPQQASVYMPYSPWPSVTPEGKNQWLSRAREGGDHYLSPLFLPYNEQERKRETEGENCVYPTSFIERFLSATLLLAFQNSRHNPSKSHTKSQKSPASAPLNPFDSTIHGKNLIIGLSGSLITL